MKKDVKRRFQNCRCQSTMQSIQTNCQNYPMHQSIFAPKEKRLQMLCYLLCPRAFLQTKLFQVSDCWLILYILEPLLSMSLRNIHARSQVINYKWLLHGNNDKPDTSNWYTFVTAFYLYEKQFINTRKATSKLHVKSSHIHCALRNPKKGPSWFMEHLWQENKLHSNIIYLCTKKIATSLNRCTLTDYVLR